MDETIQFKYNKGFGFITFFGLFALLIIFLIKTFQYQDVDAMKIVLCFDGGLFLFLIIVMVKFFIPVINRKIALEINKQGIIDNTRNQQIDWKNVKSLSLVSFRNSAGIEIELLNDNSPKLIRLQYIEGMNEETFNTINNYFKRVQS
jgi:hypothetical protein